MRNGDGNAAAMLYDLTRCIGCHFCELACQTNKELPPDVSLQSFRVVETGVYPDVHRVIRRHQCMHCLSPACASACPVGALHKTAAGPVDYDAERCIGCRYCMNACPFGVPTFDWGHGLLEGTQIHKCNLCADRLAAGDLPACVEACPTGAIVFGHRDSLLAKAKARIQAQPDRYVNHVYGETEAGGTSLLMVSGVSFASLGLPELGPEPLPALSEAVMRGTVPFALGWAAALAGLVGIIRLRQVRLEAKSEAAQQSDKEVRKGK